MGLRAVTSFLTCAFQVFLLGCADRGPSGHPQTLGGGAERAASDDQVTAAVSDSLRLWLTVPERVGLDEPVPIRLTAENVSGRELELHLRGREIAFDLTVSRAGGETVWRRLHEAMIPGILRIESLAPAEILELSDVWNQVSDEGDSVSPGRYRVKGEILTEGEPLETPTYSFHVGEP